MPMNQEIKAQWTAALRSGEYPQDKAWLRTTDGACCLGVLCDLAVQAGIITQTVPDGLRFRYEYGPGEDDILLPVKVQEWAGLTESNPHVDPETLPEGVTWDTDPGSDEGGYLLANMNDGGTPFTVIADIIDAQL